MTKRITCEKLLRAIEKNNGPENVDLSGRNLSEIDLHYNTVRDQLDREERRKPSWFSSSTHGINLKGAFLKTVNLAHAVLVQADLREATLANANIQKVDLHDSKLQDSILVGVDATGANLSYCEMQGCYLIGANLTRANLSHCQLQGADLTEANLQNAILWNTRLIETDLTDANLDKANLYSAWIINTLLTRKQIGETLIQEDEDYETPIYSVQTDEVEIDVVPGRYIQAASIYRALKNNFVSIGNYNDASWAYIKERKMRRKTQWPPRRVQENYPAEISQLPNDGLKGKWHHLVFYIRHFASGILDWIYEVTCGYGEMPLLTLWWALVCIIAFAILFRLSDEIQGAQSWIDYANYSLGSFVTMSYNDFQAEGWLSQTLTSVEALMGICLLALLMFALGNRINRS